ncbi:pseudouridine-5'-phosphate glycosidase [Proteocatella sphenisci]|nr:pseudouridine-5'-phosphate glycosidase [Proteocatella sphenisci]
MSHGMPYPRNVETALNVEQIIRDNGAIPATIAIMDGKLKVGLSKDKIESLGKSSDAIKCSRRDIPFILAKKLDGATTVASTMLIAGMAGIKVFATGGIGGVHRGAQETFDISADLQELAHTDVAVVCAGAKSILDIGLTLEYLETQGVPVVGFGTDELPAFYTSKSGFGVDYRVDTPKELAEALKTKWDLGIEGGSSLDSNIQLVYNNAVLGAKIAVELSKLK